MPSYQSFIFSKDSKEDFFGKLRAAAEKYCTQVKTQVSLMADGRNARIEFGREEYYFHFELVDAGWVIDESRDIARRFANRDESAVIGNCAWRIEFWGEDDGEMNFFNEYFALMEEIGKVKGSIVFDYPSGKFFGD